MTPQQIAQACQCSLPRATNWAAVLGAAMQLFAINTSARQAAFLAQIAHESSRLQHVLELWGPTPQQMRYEGRRDLGNVKAGDGYRYRGRGLIQITGRANYATQRDTLRLYVPAVPDFELTPELLEAPRWAALSAACYWQTRGCNELADSAAFIQITRRINGGLNGYDDRVALWDGAKAVLA
jgi:putative chitinase